MVFYLKTRPDDDNHNPQGPHNRQPGSINSAKKKKLVLFLFQIISRPLCKIDLEG